MSSERIIDCIGRVAGHEDDDMAVVELPAPQEELKVPIISLLAIGIPVRQGETVHYSLRSNGSLQLLNPDHL